MATRRPAPAALSWAAPVTRGAEEVLARELTGLGARTATAGRGAVRFEGDLEVGYRACLWSRVASRVLLEVSRFPAPDADALYEGALAVDWSDHLPRGATFAVDLVGTSASIRHSGFGALRVKDAVVDCLRDRAGRRPDVDRRAPDLRLHVHLAGDEATVSIDFAGPPLHERGGRRTGRAPLKETLAAAILWLAGWPEAAARGEPLVDPMCGSGTLLLEAAGIAGGLAPGLGRPRWGFAGWAGHDEALWRRLAGEARGMRRAIPPLYGADADAAVLRAAADNLGAAGHAEVRLARRALHDAGHPPGPAGMVVTNPPYGARLGEEDALVGLYGELGDVLRQRFLGWRAWVFTGSRRLAGAIGLRAARRIPLWNGPIECRLLSFPIAEEAPEGAPGWRRGRG